MIQYHRSKGIVFRDAEPITKPRTGLTARLDKALAKGGNLARIARDEETTLDRVREHITAREGSGNWRFEPSAGRLVRKHSRV